jgi:hypothetical protein
MASLSTLVAPVKEMHQRARQQQQIRQRTEDVRPVLGDQEEPCDAEKRKQHEP